MHEEIKEKYKSGNYRVLGLKNGAWTNLHPDNEILNEYTNITAVHNKHDEVFWASVEGKDIEVFAGTNRGGWKKEFNFIQDYNENFKYRIKVVPLQQEINEVIDKQLAEETKSEIIVIRGGADVKRNIKRYLDKNKTYEITIKEVISIN